MHAADCELFARVVTEHGGIILKDILAYYRVFEGNDTSRLRQTAENIRDVCRLNELFAKRYAEFSVELGRERAIDMARHQYSRFLKLGNEEALAAHHKILVELMPFFRKCKWQLKNVIFRRGFL